MADLTDKEAYLAQFIIDGVDTKEIAREANMKVSTLKNRLELMRAKTDTVGQNRVAFANKLRQMNRGR